MYKTIVVGTDGSKRSAIASGQAIAMCKLTGATLHVVHARGPLPEVGPGTDFASAVLAESAQAFDDGDEVCAQIQSQAQVQGVTCHMHSIEGDPAGVIVRLAEKVGADLVVVGNQGMNGVRRFVLGSVPNKVSHRCPCSLLIVDTEPS
jgi:nucleotide-binding universal stress UspA family protein